VGLRQARQQRRLTQHELATRAGIGQPAIATLERLKNPNPKWQTVARLSMALRISPWRLFGRPPRVRRNGAGA
jgi:transcriptional regulator with XRE-family HTH domain